MDCGIVTSKTVLLFLSLIFWAAGAALAYVGAYVIRSYDNFGSVIQDKYALTPAIIIIGISVVMFCFGLLGCCATIRESKFGLSFFFVIIFVIFAAEVAALVFSIIYQDKIKAGLGVSMNDVFSKYGGQGGEPVDPLQTQLHCCGVHNYTSWFNTTWFANHNRTVVPQSCCKNATGGCTGELDLLDLLNLDGCEAKLLNFIQSVLEYAMLVILGFAIIKFFGMLSVCVISCRSGSKRSGYQPLYA